MLSKKIKIIFSSINHFQKSSIIQSDHLSSSNHKYFNYLNHCNRIIWFTVVLNPNHFNISRTAFLTSLMSFDGLKKCTTSPLLLIKNLAKFHGMTSDSPVLGLCNSLWFLKKTNNGWAFSPLTSTFSKIGNLAWKFSSTNFLISSGDPLSWLKNWLHGKARI